MKAIVYRQATSSEGSMIAAKSRAFSFPTDWLYFRIRCTHIYVY
jgi:hypothetical protein